LQGELVRRICESKIVKIVLVGNRGVDLCMGLGELGRRICENKVVGMQTMPRSLDLKCHVSLYLTLILCLLLSPSTNLFSSSFYFVLLRYVQNLQPDCLVLCTIFTAALPADPSIPVYPLRSNPGMFQCLH
jgi:hypothetical protein